MFMKKERGKALLNLLNSFAKKWDGDMSKAAGEMDSELGDMWRDEMEAAGLKHEIPSDAVGCKETKESKQFYKKVKSLLNKEDLPEQQVDDGSRTFDRIKKSMKQGSDHAKSGAIITIISKEKKPGRNK